MSSDQSKSLRQELEQAIGKVRHQIETESSPTGAESLGPTQGRHLLDELGSELDRLEEALAGLEDGDA
jgi:hypothetical protein